MNLDPGLEKPGFFLPRTLIIYKMYAFCGKRFNDSSQQVIIKRIIFWIDIVFIFLGLIYLINIYYIKTSC